MIKTNEFELKKWAENELRLLANNMGVTFPGRPYGEICSAYASMIEWMKDLENIESGKSILINLMKGLPLTPIKDDEDSWKLIESPKEGVFYYQCLRYPSFYKKVIVDGDKGCTEYVDVSRCISIDINKETIYSSSGLELKIFNELFPLTMPYLPIGNFKMYTENFRFSNDEDDIDLDTFGILYIELPSGDARKIYRFFKKDLITGAIEEIEKEEYLSRLRTRDSR